MVVFDVDGTLYEQGPVRWRMLRALASTPGEGQAAGGLGRIARFRAIARFRVLREGLAEEAPEGFDEELFERFAGETGISTHEARRLIDDWMVQRPLPYLANAAVPGAGALFAALRQARITIGIWSDYPAQAKLSALGLEADHVVCATDNDVGALKPRPKGLDLLAAQAGCAPDHVLMVGDRLSRDGAAATAFGCPFMLRAKRGPADIPRVIDFVGFAREMST